MLYEKEIAKDHYHSIINKEDYSYFLITCAFEDYKKLSKNEFIILTVKWKKKVKENIHLDDVGYALNGGNIFVVVDNQRRQGFLEEISKISFTKANKSSIYSEVIELNKDEIRTIMF
ncbi:hypothetical protein bcgnr5369_02210 [Bacillus cereus]|uniref:Uncharacterized protein n=2 Tax=Bacillus cereus group TaxID=86661 RepID=A0A9X6WH27_BACTU|nr:MULTISPECIES: hypothetical protein [Bacillus cereus group]PFJ29355.1 hypothetical protein COJ15_31695 [Bacillus thuringiensis]PGP12592.1 hypothetical protein COA01_32775 [Bacillus cereus]